MGATDKTGKNQLGAGVIKERISVLSAVGKFGLSGHVRVWNLVCSYRAGGLRASTGKSRGRADFLSAVKIRKSVKGANRSEGAQL